MSLSRPCVSTNEIRQVLRSVNLHTASLKYARLRWFLLGVTSDTGSTQWSPPPIPKRGDPSNPNNHDPNFLTPVIWQVFVTGVFDRPFSSLESEELPSVRPYGFQSRHLASDLFSA